MSQAVDNLTPRQRQALERLRRTGKITSKGVTRAGFIALTFDELVKAGLATREYRFAGLDSYYIWKWAP